MPMEEARQFRNAAIDAAENLGKDIKELSGYTNRILAFSKRTRFLLKLLAASVVFEFFLTMGLVFSFHIASAAKSDVNVAKVAAYESCLETNKVRSAQTMLWGTVLSDESVSRIPSADKLRALTLDTFKQKDCVKP